MKDTQGYIRRYIGYIVRIPPMFGYNRIRVGYLYPMGYMQDTYRIHPIGNKVKSDRKGDHSPLL